MNCMALEHQGQLMVIDCGVQFPDGDYGIDVVHPDWSWLLQRNASLQGVVLTHGHEDHIGALPYFLKRFQVPVWGPQHALSLVQRRLQDHALDAERLTFIPVEAGKSFSVGSFEVEPIAVTHSIVEATALAVTTPAGRVVHTGDFKFDPSPSDGKRTDEARLSALGDEGVDLLLSDSTNVFSHGTSASEGEVHEGLLDVVSEAKHRVVVALFASNVQRLISLGRIARATGRRIALLGRSLLRHVEVARRLGYLDWPDALLLSVENLGSYPRAEVLVLAGGTQGEPASAMGRLADGSHRFLKLTAGDTVLFSSRVIPGNEREVSEMVDRLMRQRVRVIAGKASAIHASGHACRAEQERMLRLIRPKCFVPVHGTLQHLHAHAQLARELGVKQVLVSENGVPVCLRDGNIALEQAFETGVVNIDMSGSELDEATLRERREMARGGVLSLSVKVAKDQIAVESQGVLWTDDDSRQEFRELVTERLKSLRGAEPKVLNEELKRAARHWIWTRMAARPVIVIHVEE